MTHRTRTYTEIGRIRALRSRAAQIVSQWQELIVWLPFAVALALAAWYVIPHIDRTAGMDGWGALWAYLITGIGVAVAGFLAWLIARTYHLDFDDDTERELIDYAAGMDRAPDGTAFGHGMPSWQATAVWLGHRAFFLALFWLILGKLLP